MNVDLATFSQTAVPLLTTVGFKIVGAIVIWLIGRMLIRFAVGLLGKALNRQHFDQTIIGYVKTSVGVVLTLGLIIALLGFFGVETTSFAALLAGVGIAVGAAWSGLLSNLAAGLFLVVLRPFKTGDFVTVAGVTGTVGEISLFSTAINTPDNVRTIVGNAKIFADTIQNFSTNPFRRVDLVAQLDTTADHAKAIAILTEALKRVPNVCATPAPEVTILSSNFAGPVLAVRPYTHTDSYWQVYFDSNRVVRETLIAAGFTIPGEHRYEHQMRVSGASA
jgi:small conductance mechanosensitive channel